MAQPISQILAKRLLLTNFEEEKQEYILTPEEEQQITDHEIQRAKNHAIWKMRETTILSEEEILLRISKTDWSKEVKNLDEILQRANNTKHYDIWQKQQRENEKAEAENRKKELCEKWTSKEFFKYIKWVSQTEYGNTLIVNDDTLSIIRPLCYFLGNDERFESELNFSFKKGLMFRGVSGLGKTYIVKCAAQNEVHKIAIMSMLEIAEDVKGEGEFNLPTGYSKYYLDDVGSEEHIQNHYGTRINWFKNFLETFYLRSQSYNRLIISTNNNAKEIEDKYGFRVRSRIKDMFNVVDVTGKDLRGL